MKAVALIFFGLLCATLSAFSAIPAEYSVRRAEINGQEYVRLSDWARRQNFSVRWSKSADVVELSRPGMTLLLNRDSREGEMGGVKICLSYPVIVRDNAGYISELDLQTALMPVLSPRKQSGTRIKTIVLDPGHGGADPGNVDGSHQEKKYTLLMAQELQAQLRKAGFNVYLTRDADVFIKLGEQPVIARQRGADLFISLHWNKIPGKSEIKGAQIFCLTPAGASSSNSGGEGITAGRKPGNRNNEQNMLLAYLLQRSLLGNVGMEDRGVRRARYWVLRDAEMPAVLIEGGFMSNPGEARKIYDADYRSQMARAIVTGILNYRQQVE